MIAEERVLLGRITGVHGLKGEVKILAYTGQPEDIAAYGVLTGANGERHFRISAIRSVKGATVIAILDGISDRDEAEKLRGTDLYVSRTALPLARRRRRILSFRPDRAKSYLPRRRDNR